MVIAVLSLCDQNDSYTAIDCLGDFNGDPGSAWDVCGEGDTKDNTLVRNIGVSGNLNGLFHLQLTHVNGQY